MSFLSGMTNSYKSNVQKNLQQLGATLLSDLTAKLSSFGIPTALGALGDIAFTVSSSKVVTFNNLKQNTKGRYTSHDVIGQKPILEYIGPDLEEITFTMQFAMQAGVEPRIEVAKVREKCQKAEPLYFVLNNQTVGENPWIIESVGESVNTVDNLGRIIVTEIEVTLKEYVADSTGT